MGVDVDVGPWVGVDVGSSVGVGVSPPPRSGSVGVGVEVGVAVGVSVAVGVTVVVGVVVTLVMVKAACSQDLVSVSEVPELEQSTVPSTLHVKDVFGTSTVPRVALWPVGSVGTSKVATRLSFIYTLACWGGSFREELLDTVTTPFEETENT